MLPNVLWKNESIRKRKLFISCIQKKLNYPFILKMRFYNEKFQNEFLIWELCVQNLITICQPWKRLLIFQTHYHLEECPYAWLNPLNRLSAVPVRHNTAINHAAWCTEQSCFINTPVKCVTDIVPYFLLVSSKNLLLHTNYWVREGGVA